MKDAVEILDSLSAYLSDSLANKAINLAKSEADGRLNSQANERQIAEALCLFALVNERFKSAKLNITLPQPRFWYDFAISQKGGVFLPINIKVSTLKGNDNLSSKSGVFYALTGVDPKTLNINDWNSFFNLLAKNLNKNPDADYYFLIVNKLVLGDVFWTSLKTLSEFTPNGANPPFQCDWSKNRERNDRNGDAAQNYILQTLGKTFKLRADAWGSFNKYFGDRIKL
ncbi:MAG: restriction endonuclease [Helicobacteraceae bacterium]|jgi:hypothetical protein|nr:restriction endonuclease [Helicobacteraceae bacterium]